ncbi:hypothetical protein GCM10017744_070760 [Streptomyces antimycoticus]|uniref:Uncharacterized protein n=7 Tax=Streptomyces TaxID=1883 RepID=A0A4D4K6D7_9ACTN|nr:hypothetical protein SANT12839_031000 [Streptomyces antimycoticus]
MQGGTEAGAVERVGQGVGVFDDDMRHGLALLKGYAAAGGAAAWGLLRPHRRTSARSTAEHPEPAIRLNPSPVSASVPARIRFSPDPGICFNSPMASLHDIATGRYDLEPFWPSRQAHHFDRECCRASDARARSLGR